MISDRIKLLRESHNLTQSSVAKRFGTAKAAGLKSDFRIRISRCGIVKILVNPTGLTAFCASPHHKILLS